MELLFFLYIAGVGAATSAFFTEMSASKQRGGRPDPFATIIVIPMILFSWIGYAMLMEHRR
jgi:hypothetical protein